MANTPERVRLWFRRRGLSVDLAERAIKTGNVPLVAQVGLAARTLPSALPRPGLCPVPCGHTESVRKESKTTKKGYYELRLCESQRGVDTDPTWYTVRVMKDSDPGLAKGDFVKVTGKLKTDFYMGRDGKPTGTLLIIAFEATKISKHVADQDELKETGKEKAPAKEPVNARATAKAPAFESVRLPEPLVRVQQPARQPDPMQTSNWAEW